MDVLTLIALAPRVDPAPTDSHHTTLGNHP
jgi:hypothetical protein